MDDIDGMLARLATVTAPASLGDDPGFVARLDASATRGAAWGAARSAAAGALAAVLMVAVHVGTAPGPDVGGAGGPLLSTASGVTL